MYKSATTTTSFAKLASSVVSLLSRLQSPPSQALTIMPLQRPPSFFSFAPLSLPCLLCARLWKRPAYRQVTLRLMLLTPSQMGLITHLNSTRFSIANVTCHIRWHTPYPLKKPQLIHGPDIHSLLQPRPPTQALREVSNAVLAVNVSPKHPTNKMGLGDESRLV